MSEGGLYVVFEGMSAEGSYVVVQIVLAYDLDDALYLQVSIAEDSFQCLLYMWCQTRPTFRFPAHATCLLINREDMNSPKLETVLHSATPSVIVHLAKVGQ